MNFQGAVTISVLLKGTASREFTLDFFMNLLPGALNTVIPKAKYELSNVATIFETQG
jgi:hypothetical protein